MPAETWPDRLPPMRNRPIPPKRAGADSRIVPIVIGVLLVALSLAVYRQTLGFGFIYFDDDAYVAGNPMVRGGLTWEGIRWALTTFHESNWHPLTWLSLMLDAEIGGSEARIFHATNLLLHAANTLLLFLLLLITTRAEWRSGFVAALFAVHPLHVESVAWIAERKDVLSTAFWLLAMLAYVRYARRPGAARFALVMAMFALGLTAKPMLVTLPLVLLLWDAWPLGRLGPPGSRAGARAQAGIPGEAPEPRAAQSQGESAGARLVTPPRREPEAASARMATSSRREPEAASTHMAMPPRREPEAAGARVATSSRREPDEEAGVASGDRPRQGRKRRKGRRSRPDALAPAANQLNTDVWQGASVLSLVREKTPLLALAAASSLVTLVAQSRGGAMATFEVYAFPDRAANAVVSYGRYILKTIWPVDLGVYYPHPLGSLPVGRAGGALLALAAVTTLSMWLWRRRPYVAVGWLWYLVTLVPVIGLVQVGGQAMADRYTYVPLIGLFIVAAWAAPDLAGALRARLGRRLRGAPEAGRAPSVSGAPAADRAVRGALGLLAVAIVLVLTVLGNRQARLWSDPVSLFEHTARVTGPNAVAQQNIGTSLFERGEAARAAEHLREAIRLNPGYPDAHSNLCAALLQSGQVEEAIAVCRDALRQWPDRPRLHTNLGIAASMKGNLSEAYDHFREALRLDPDHADAHLNLGVALETQGRLDDAIAEFSTVLRINPFDPGARESLARAREKKRLQAATSPAD